MIEFRITTETPDNMLRAIRAACTELLGETRQAGEQEWPHAVSADEKAAQRVTEANRLNAAANSELDQAAASLSAHNVAEAFNQTSCPSVEELQASGQLANVRVEHQDEAHLDLKPETDSAGAEWNPELHASTKAKNQDGTWKKRRGAASLVAQSDSAADQATQTVAEAIAANPGAAIVHDEVQVSALPPLPPGGQVPPSVPDAPPSLPPAPTAPAAPLVTMNDIYALITNGKCVLNNVIAAAQAMGFADLGAFSQGATPEQRAQLLAQLTKEVA